MVGINELREILDSNHEWLLVRESGRSFSLTHGEIALSDENGNGASIEFLDDQGIHTQPFTGYSLSDRELSIEVVDRADGSIETVRLVPRVSAAELIAEIEIARLEQANEIARQIADHIPPTKLVRVALNTDNGRLAQISFETAEKKPIAAIADVTASLTVEAIFTAAILWLEKLGERKKKPVLDIWIVCEKRQAKNSQKMHALLSDRWKAKISVFEIVRKNNAAYLDLLPRKRLGDLWREKATKLKLHGNVGPGDIGAAITKLAPAKIDTIYSRHGATLRFHGLPFARIRKIKETEKAWFGVGRERRLVTAETWPELEELVSLLEQNRTHAPENKRHEYYRASPEAWLESILSREISLLDANLILSPIYNQFRSSNDKIDLLALRRDGRLVIIELKTQPDREVVFQAADYWRKIELQRRRGILAAADLFEGRGIMDKPALVYLAAPAWSFHRDFEFFASAVSPEIELWRFELHEDWRRQIKVLARHSYADGGFTKR